MARSGQPPLGPTQACVNSRRDLARGLKRPLHPRVPVRHVIAGEKHPALRLYQLWIDVFARLSRERRPGPVAPGHAVPGDRESVLEFGLVLRVDARALLERELLALLGRPLAERTRLLSLDVITVQHALPSVEPMGRIDDLGDLLIGV